MTERSMNKRRGLGRGLSALMSDYDEPAAEGAALREADRLPIDLLRPNPFQPRSHFDAERIAELSASIKEKGVLQPILVRPAEREGGERAYEIVAGERRWRAAQAAGLHEVPVVVHELADHEALEVAIVENVQRRDLSPVEEARGYRRLIDEFGRTQDDVARTVGKSRSHIANLLRLLGLPAEVQQMLDDGRLSMGHARALVGAEDPVALAKRIASEGLNVRRAEDLASREKPGGTRAPRAAAAKDADTRALENDLSQALGLKVEIVHKGGEGGSVSIRYRTLEQLDDLCQRLIGH